MTLRETDKEQLASTTVVLLGVEINLETGRMRLAPKKAARYAQRVA